MTYQMSVQTSPGEGLLSRRTAALLFIPEPHTNSELLLEAFATARDGSELDALASATIDAGLDVPHFAAVQIGADIVVRVFGAAELRTDVPSVPLLSAGASTTWVEHRVHETPSVAVISSGEGQPDPRTEVILGVVNAGGFEVKITCSPNQLAVDESATGSLASATPLELPPSIAGKPRNDEQPEQSELLEYVLGAFPKPAIELEKREPIGELIFDDGQKHVLSGDVVLGRNPIEKAEGAKAHPLIVAGDRVSRAHLRVCVTGHQVWVEDCGSRNGSVLVGSPDDEPFKLLPNSPQEIESGAVLYLGSRSFTFVEGGHGATVPLSTTRKDPIYG